MAIGAERIFWAQADVGGNPQDLPHQRVEPLRQSMRRPRRFSGSAVANRNIEIAVVGVPWPRRRVKNQIGHRVIAIVAGAQDFTRRTLKRGIADIRVGPLHEH